LFATCLVLAVKFNEELGFRNSAGQVFHDDRHFRMVVPTMSQQELTDA
jgi:hypothetical protein